MYKIIHNLVEIHAEHLHIPFHCRTRGIAAFRTIYTRIDIYRCSLYARTINTWNSIASGQYHRPVQYRDMVHYPLIAVQDGNSVPPCFNCKYNFDFNCIAWTCTYSQPWIYWVGKKKKNSLMLITIRSLQCHAVLPWLNHVYVFGILI